MFLSSLKFHWLHCLLINKMMDVTLIVLEMSATFWIQRGNGAVKVSFEHRMTHMSALLQILICTFCILLPSASSTCFVLFWLRSSVAIVWNGGVCQASGKAVYVSYEFALHGSDSFGSSEPKETNACNKWPVYQHPPNFVNSSIVDMCTHWVHLFLKTDVRFK